MRSMEPRDKRYCCLANLKDRLIMLLVVSVVSFPAFGESLATRCEEIMIDANERLLEIYPSKVDNVAQSVRGQLFLKEQIDGYPVTPSDRVPKDDKYSTYSPCIELGVLSTYGADLLSKALAGVEAQKSLQLYNTCADAIKYLTVGFELRTKDHDTARELGLLIGKQLGGVGTVVRHIYPENELMTNASYKSLGRFDQSYLSDLMSRSTDQFDLSACDKTGLELSEFLTKLSAGFKMHGLM